jgi:hypothetical protein
MRFRNLALPALLAGVATIVSIVFTAISLNSFAAKISQSYIELLTRFAPSIFLPSLVLSLFFFFVFAEGSGQIKGGVRAKAAVVFSCLMVLFVMGKMLRFGLFAYELWKMPDLIHLNRSAFVHDFITIVWDSCLAAFLIAFATQRGTAASGVIPKLAGVLGAFTLYGAVWSSMQVHALDYSLALSLRSLAVILVSAATHLLFFVVVWRKWRPNLPVHENVVS